MVLFSCPGQLLSYTNDYFSLTSTQITTLARLYAKHEDKIQLDSNGTAAYLGLFNLDFICNSAHNSPFDQTD
jgi:hypothetical protein